MATQLEWSPTAEAAIAPSVPIVEARMVEKTYDTARSRCTRSAASTWRSPAARWSRSWARAAPARRRCSTASPASTRSTWATSSSREPRSLLCPIGSGPTSGPAGWASSSSSLGLGLVVGVAALGVITARAVVERRQQIGVLRSIGFRRRMIQAAFLAESSFVALTAIVVGTLLGLAISYNVLADSAEQPTWSNLTFDVPWLSLGVIFVLVYAVALLTTLAPALRASRVYPAEALRYQ